MWRPSLPRIFQRSFLMVREAIGFGMLQTDQNTSDQLQTEPDHVQRLRHLHKTLVICMEPESGLVDHLLSVGVFSHRELEYVHSEDTVCQKNSWILEFMCEKNEEQYAKFLDALHSTKQSHIVKFLDGNGNISPDYPDDRPLTEQEVSIITRNLNNLVRRLEPYSVMDHLFALDCLTRRSITLIKSKQTKDDVTKQLLDILTRRSKRDLKTFHAILKEHGQHSAALILEPVLSIIGFIPDSRKHEIKHESKCFINDLPLEVLERILIKVFGVQLSRTPHLVKQSTTVSVTVQLLGSISSSWQALMMNEKFKTLIMRQISEIKMQMGDSERISKLVADTVLMLCKNSIHFNSELKVKGLVGVISDATNIFLVEINETFGCTNDVEPNPEAAFDASGKVPTRRKLEMTTMPPPRKMMALMAPPTCGASSNTIQAQDHQLQHLTKEQLALVRSSPAKGAVNSFQTVNAAMRSQPRMTRPILALLDTAAQRRTMAARMQKPNNSFRGCGNGTGYRGQAVRKSSAALLAGRQVQSGPLPRQALSNGGRLRGMFRAAGGRGMRQVQPVKRVVKKMNPHFAPTNAGSQIVMPSPQSMASSPLVTRGVMQLPGNQRKLLSPGQSIQKLDGCMQLAIAQPPRYSQALAVTSPRMVNPTQSPVAPTNQRMEGQGRMQLSMMSSGRYSQSLALPSSQMVNRPPQSSMIPPTLRMEGRGRAQGRGRVQGRGRGQVRGRMVLAAMPSPQYSQSLALPSPQMVNPQRSPMTSPTQRMEGPDRMQLSAMPSPQYSQSLALPSPQMGNPPVSVLNPMTQRVEGHGSRMQLATMTSRNISVSVQSSTLPFHGNRLPLFVSTSMPVPMHPTEIFKQETSTAVLSPKHLVVVCPSLAVPPTASDQPPGTHPVSLQAAGTGGENRFVSTSGASELTTAFQYSPVRGINLPQAIMSPTMGSPGMKVQTKLVSTSSQATRMACVRMQTGNIVGSDLQAGTLPNSGHCAGTVPSSNEAGQRAVGAANPQTPGTTLPHPFAVTVLRSSQQGFPASDHHVFSPFKRKECAVQNLLLSGALNPTQMPGNQSVSMASTSATDTQAEAARFAQFLIAPTRSPQVGYKAIKVEVDDEDQLVAEIVSRPGWMQSQQVMMHQSLGQQPQHGQNVTHGQQQQEPQNQQQLMPVQHRALQGSSGQQVQLQTRRGTLGRGQSQQVGCGQQQQMIRLGQQPQMTTHGQQSLVSSHGQQPLMSIPGQQIMVLSHGHQQQMSTPGQPRPPSTAQSGQQKLHHPPNNPSPLVICDLQTSVATSQVQQELHSFIVPGHSRPSFLQQPPSNRNLSQTQNHLIAHSQQTPQSQMQQTFPGWQAQSMLKSRNLQPGAQSWQKSDSVAQPTATKSDQTCFVQSLPAMQSQIQQQLSLQPLSGCREPNVDRLSSGQSSRTTASNLSYDQIQLQPSDQISVPLPVAVVSAGKVFQPAQSPLYGQAFVAQVGIHASVVSNSHVPNIQQTATSVPILRANLIRSSESNLLMVNQPEPAFQQAPAQNLKTLIQNILENQPDRISPQRDSPLFQTSANDAHRSARNREESSVTSQFPVLPSDESSAGRCSLKTSQAIKNDREDLNHEDRESQGQMNEFDLDAFAFSQVQKLVELKQMELERSSKVASSTSSGQMERNVKFGRSRMENLETGLMSQLNLEEPDDEVPAAKFLYEDTMVASGCEMAAESLGDRGSLVPSPISPSETIAYSEGGSPLRLEESDLEDLEENLKNYAQQFMLFGNEKVSYFRCSMVGCRFAINNEADLAGHYTHVHTGDIALEPADADSRYLPLLESARMDDAVRVSPGISCPFPSCCRAFAKISGVYNHHLKAHKVGLTKRQKKALSSKYGLIYHCEVCLRDFISKSDLQHHMTKTRHGK